MWESIEHGAWSEEPGVRIEVSGFSVQVSGAREVPAVRFKILCLFFLTPET